MTKHPLMTADDVRDVVVRSLESLALQGKRVVVVVPDSTRTMPLSLFFRAICKALQGKAKQLDFLIALGTHPPMSESAILRMFGLTADERQRRYTNVGLLNHAWQDPNALVTLGRISEDEASEISGGLMRESVDVRLNRAVVDYDEIIICGPVFPHEVAGFSGGNKYFFPGISGEEVIHFTHWLGALLTSYDLIGVADTPTRKMIDRAAALIPTSRHALCSVVTSDGVHGVFFGTPEQAWAQAWPLSSQVHITWLDAPYRRMLAVLPEMYDEIWVGGKGVYKLEPAVAAGGEIVIFAPHIREISATHGKAIRAIGYHVRDYFVKQLDRFKDVPRSAIAHSTHVRGIGEYDAATRVESPRITVTLATGISEAETRAVCLNYCDPRAIDPSTWARAADELVVPHAGEQLFRVKP